MIEDLLAFFQAFLAMNARLIQAVVEAPVAVVLENGVVDGFDDPGALGNIGQLGVMLLELVPQEQAAVVFQKPILVAEFLPLKFNLTCLAVTASTVLRGKIPHFLYSAFVDNARRAAELRFVVGLITRSKRSPGKVQSAL